MTQCPVCREELLWKDKDKLTELWCPACGYNKENLIPPLAMAEVERVLQFGAKKHSPWGWRGNTDAEDWAAFERHETEVNFYSQHDHESNLHPLAHAICRLMFILDRKLEANK